VSAFLIVLLCLPLAATAVSLGRSLRVAEAASLAAALAAFALTVALAISVRHGAEHAALGQWLRLDSLGAVFLLATGFLYAAGVVFSIGYLRAGAHRTGFTSYARRYYSFLNLFCWTMLLVPLMNDFGTLWVALELTTIVSVLLVAVDRTDAALEAAWKYVLIASVGLGIGLLAVILLYAAGTGPLGDAYIPRFASYVAAAHRLPTVQVEFAFLLGHRFRHEGRLRAAAHVAARRAQRSAEPRVGAPLRLAAGDCVLRDPSFLPGDRAGGR